MQSVSSSHTFSGETGERQKYKLSQQFMHHMRILSSVCVCVWGGGGGEVPLKKSPPKDIVSSQKLGNVYAGPYLEVGQGGGAVALPRFEEKY